MTTLTLDRLLLRTPDALCCALPHLLGFIPENSAVAVWLAGGRLLVTQRVDLPTGTFEADAWAQAVVDHAGSAAADSVIAVLVTAAGDPSTASLSGALCNAARSRGVEVLDVLQLDAQCWRSLLCSDTVCCPPEGRQIDAEVRNRIDAEFALEGSAPRGSRDDVVRQLDPEPGQVAAVLSTGVLDRRTRSASLERWREAGLANVTQWCFGQKKRSTPARSAHLIRALADIRVRDTLLWELCGMDTGELRRAADQLRRLVQAAPPGHVAPVALCLAVAAWLAGDGVQASVAVDRALDDDADHVLVGLLASALTMGLPPWQLRDVIREVGRDTCRRGAAPST